MINDSDNQQATFFVSAATNACLCSAGGLDFSLLSIVLQPLPHFLHICKSAEPKTHVDVAVLIGSHSNMFAVCVDIAFATIAAGSPLQLSEKPHHRNPSIHT